MEKIIVDTDFIIAYLLQADSKHQKAVDFLDKNPEISFIITNLVQYETATVLSRLLNQEKAIEYFEIIDWGNMEIIYMSESLSLESFAIYKSQTKKNISVTDCANLVLARKLNRKLASFDKFYPSEIRI